MLFCCFVVVLSIKAGGDVEAAKKREEELQRQLLAERDAVTKTQSELNSLKGSFEKTMATTDEGKMLLKRKHIDDMVRCLIVSLAVYISWWIGD